MPLFRLSLNLIPSDVRRGDLPLLSPLLLMVVVIFVSKERKFLNNCTSTNFKINQLFAD